MQPIQHIMCPAGRSKMLSETGITLAGHTITAVQLLGIGELVLGIGVFLLAFHRVTRTTLKRSVVSDELQAHMGRIADALERIANQATDRKIRRSSRAATEPLTNDTVPPDLGKQETQRVSYSMFGLDNR